MRRLSDVASGLDIHPVKKKRVSIGTEFPFDLPARETAVTFSPQASQDRVSFARIKAKGPFSQRVSGDSLQKGRTIAGELQGVLREQRQRRQAEDILFYTSAANSAAATRGVLVIDAQPLAFDFYSVRISTESAGVLEVLIGLGWMKEQDPKDIQKFVHAGFLENPVAYLLKGVSLELLEYDQLDGTALCSKFRLLYINIVRYIRDEGV